MTVVGVVRNHRAPAAADAFAQALADRGQAFCILEAEELRWDGLFLHSAAATSPHVTHVAPPLLYGEPSAAWALSRAAEGGVRMLNLPEAVAVADDKELCARRLAACGVPQPKTVILGSQQVLAREWQSTSALVWPVVAKRPEGALGMWVRLCGSVDELEAAAAELTCEGPTSLVIQQAVTESLGRAVRALTLAGEVVLATERVAPLGEWRSNVAQGATQHLVELSGAEESAALSAAAACGLKWAGVDLVRTSSGPLVLEVNASPGFTSMQPHCPWSIADRVVGELLTQ